MKFQLATAQFSPFKKNVAANLDRIAGFLEQAAGESIDVVLFPESAVTGYFLEGGVLECALTTEALTQELHARLGKLAREIDFAVGFYEIESGNLYNSAAYFNWSSAGLVLVHCYRKFFLPTYGVFDEERFVARGSELSVFETRFGPMSLLICEDVWHSISSTICAIKGAQVILVPSASPARGFAGEKPGNVLKYEQLLSAISAEHNVFTANAALCGFEGGKGFPGGSLICDPDGQVLVSSPLQDEHLAVAEIDLERLRVARSRSPLLGDLQSAWGDIVRNAEEAHANLA
ncbi:MAG: hypothetical protein JNJ45_09015 [Chthonomonas sp.]|nr:hypothetical protein [Chthonomonas sp.]